MAAESNRDRRIGINCSAAVAAGLIAAVLLYTTEFAPSAQAEMLLHRARLISFESGQFSSLLGMVAAGPSITLAPEIAVDRNAGCRYVRLQDARAIRTIVAAALCGRSSNRVQQTFLRSLQIKNSGAWQTFSQMRESLKTSEGLAERRSEYARRYVFNTG
jgi:DNA-binding transcriptional LysR family regulator